MGRENRNNRGGDNRKRGGNDRPPQGGGPRPAPGAKEPSLDEALDALLMQDWFRAGLAEALASGLESPTAPPAVRDWLRQRLGAIIAEGEDERRDVVESWAEEANEMQEMMRGFQEQHRELQKMITDEQRQFNALAARLRHTKLARSRQSVPPRPCPAASRRHPAHELEPAD